MKVICTKNEKHEEFITTAHVAQDWKVDSNGEFLEAIKGSEEVTHYPDENDWWVCAICGARAEVTD